MTSHVRTLQSTPSSSSSSLTSSSWSWPSLSDDQPTNQHQLHLHCHKHLTITIAMILLISSIVHIARPRPQGAESAYSPLLTVFLNKRMDVRTSNKIGWMWEYLIIFHNKIQGAEYWPLKIQTIASLPQGRGKLHIYFEIISTTNQVVDVQYSLASVSFLFHRNHRLFND